jgi:hypothetical protein
VDDVALLVLLDFLMGDSVAQVAARHRLATTREAESLIRAAVLRHGYAVGKPRA